MLMRSQMSRNNVYFYDAKFCNNVPKHYGSVGGSSGMLC